MKKILIFLSLLYLASCKGCDISPVPETAEDCNQRKGFNEQYECCYATYKGKFYDNRMDGNICVEVPKRIDLLIFASQKESSLRENGLKFLQIKCSNRSYNKDKKYHS